MGNFLFYHSTTLQNYIDQLACQEKYFQAYFDVRFYGLTLKNSLKVGAGRVKRRKISCVFPICINPLNYPIQKLLYLCFLVMRDDERLHWLNHFELNLLLLLAGVLTDE